MVSDQCTVWRRLTRRFSLEVDQPGIEARLDPAFFHRHMRKVEKVQ